jgi:ubiquinone biosynthesis protein COQ4
MRVQKGVNDLVKNFNFIGSNQERVNKLFKYAVKAVKDPENGEHVSRLGDLTSMHTLRWIKIKMEETEEGQSILKEQPRITEETTNFQKLKEYPVNTLGYNYHKYMKENGFSPDERPVARYIPNMELAYICQRYKETHDFYHVLLNFGRSVPEELAVKWFEALHLRLPSSSIASLFGGFSLSIGNFAENLKLSYTYLPNVINNANNSKFIMGYYFEKRMEQDIDDLRKELNIKLL